MRSFASFVLLAVCLAFTACSGSGGGTPPPPPPPTLTSISVAPSSGAAGPYSAFKGDTLTFVATGHYSDGSTKALSGVTWTSSATGVATIDSTGKATAVAPSATPTTITASSGGVNGTTTLTVVPKLLSIAIAATTAPTIALNTTAQFQAIGTYDDASVLNLTTLVTWTATDVVVGTNVATISNSAGTKGLATGKNAGGATISTTYTQAGTTSTPSPAAVASNNLTLTVTNATLQSIAITPASPIALGIGFQKLLTCTGTFSDSSKQDITNLVAWGTNRSDLATVSASSGVVTGTGIGSATITAITRSPLPSLSAPSATVNVDASSVASVAILPSAPQIASATNIQLRALATLTDGSTLFVTTVRGINWASSQPIAVASIAATNGYVVSQGTGNSTISVDLGTPSPATSASTNLTVTGATIVSVAVTPGTATIAPTTTQRFVATGTFSDTTTQDITDTSAWASSTSAATIAQTGLATAGPSQGAAQITAGFPGASPTKTGSAALTVTGANLASIAVTPANSFIPPAGIVQYTATGKFSDNSTQVLNSVTWSSDMGTVASIDSNGVATGNGGGTANITATLGSVTGTTSLLVTSSPLESIAISPASPTIAQQTGLMLSATGTFQDGTTRDLSGSVHWTSSDGNTATVGNSGSTQGVVLSQAVATNTNVTITASLNGVSGSTTLTVTSATLSSIAITPATPAITLGQTQQLKATGNFSDGSTQDLTLFANWTSSNTTVAVVDASGLVTSAGKGNANITAAMNGQSNHVTITVQ